MALPRSKLRRIHTQKTRERHDERHQQHLQCMSSRRQGVQCVWNEGQARCDLPESSGVPNLSSGSFVFGLFVRAS